MTKNDERLIEASIHYAIAECGGLARVTTPYQMNRRTKMGVGFDYLDIIGYMRFSHRPEKKLKKKTSYHIECSTTFTMGNCQRS